MDKKAIEKRNKEKLAEGWGCAQRNPHYCKTCIFSHGQSPFENSPEKRYCMIYNRESGISKPEHVYFDGKQCEYYKKEEGSED